MRNGGTGLPDGPFHPRPILSHVILSDRRESKDPHPPEAEKERILRHSFRSAQNDNSKYVPSFHMSS